MFLTSQIYFLLYMPLTRDTLLYSNVKLDWSQTRWMDISIVWDISSGGFWHTISMFSHVLLFSNITMDAPVCFGFCWVSYSSQINVLWTCSFFFFPSLMGLPSIQYVLGRKIMQINLTIMHIFTSMCESWFLGCICSTRLKLNLISNEIE